MITSLQPEILLKTVGKAVKSDKGEYLGRIEKVMHDEDGKSIEYLILESDGFLDNSRHRYAIPASSTFVKLTDSKNVILRLSKEAMHFAKSVAKDKCPKPNFRGGASLYELI